MAPTAVTYNCCQLALAKGGGPLELGRQLLGEMRGRGVRPDVATYVGLLSGCKAGGEWEAATECEDTLQKTHRPLW